jgi:segregation and condensation protein A
MVTDDFTVRLERVFQGPLDLLLHLVREQEVEIHEVELARVIDGYFEYLGQLEELDIELAGEFLVMAATLMSIKSRSLLPSEEVELDDELDPQDELIQRLIEYRRFKGAADDLEDRHVRRSLEHGRGYKAEVRDNEPERTLDLGELTAWDLLATFSRLMRETLSNRPHLVKGDPRPLRWYVASMGRAIQRHGSLGLRELLLDFDDEPTKEGLIGCFCALLELMKIGVVGARQDEQSGEIEVCLKADLGDDLDDIIGASRFMDEDATPGLGRADTSEDAAPGPPGSADEPETPADAAPSARSDSLADHST